MKSFTPKDEPPSRRTIDPRLREVAVEVEHLPGRAETPVGDGACFGQESAVEAGVLPRRFDLHGGGFAGGHEAEPLAPVEVERQLEGQGIDAAQVGRRATQAGIDDVIGWQAGVHLELGIAQFGAQSGAEALHVGDAEVDGCAFPADGLGGHAEGGEVGLGERAGELELGVVEHGLVDAAIAKLGRDAAGDVELLGQDMEILGGHHGLAVGAGDGLFERQGQHGTGQGLRAAPLGAEFAHDRRLPVLALVNQGPHHGGGDHQGEDQYGDEEDLEGDGIADARESVGKGV